MSDITGPDDTRRKGGDAVRDPEGSAPSPGGAAGRELLLLRAAVAAIGEAILVTSPDLDPPGPRIEYVNPAFTRMTGYAPEEVLGRTPRLLQGPKTDRAVLDRLRAALAAGQDFRGETINYRKDGSEFVIEWLITPVLDGGRVAHWVAAQRDVTEQKRAEERQRRLTAEVNHRVNNTLAAMQAVAAQTVRTAPSPERFRLAFQDRLRALARVHRLLSEGCWSGAPLQALAEVQVGAFLQVDSRPPAAPSNDQAAFIPRTDSRPPAAPSDDQAAHVGGAHRLRTEGPEVTLRPGAAVALGMTLHELAANAAAHGALSVPGGAVELRWTVGPDGGGDRLRLAWTETGGPPVPGPPARRGFGSRLIERGLAQELQAGVRLLFEPGGLRCELDAPLAAVTA